MSNENQGPSQQEVLETLKAKHGRVFHDTVPSGELVAFRAAGPDEMKEWSQSVEKKHSSSATRKQLAYRLVVHPRSDDPDTGLDQFKALIQRWPGIYNAICSDALTQAGDDVEFVAADQYQGGRLPEGAAMFGVCPDGEVVFIRGPNDSEWSRYQDSKSSSYDKGVDLARAIFVRCERFGFDDLHAKYPRLCTQMVDAGCVLIGATLQFASKKG